MLFWVVECYQGSDILFSVERMACIVLLLMTSMGMSSSFRVSTGTAMNYNHID